ncbi:MAG: S-layer homology domain-containing protein [Jaaginema sp. PMC 1079.18]|nr:S-layer homology domain-containing protein [Jaaginema sp. PMC 1080.18]MEC4852428.1 S-layer homology domain-containing protein [Jaaginema sp. PMC 1079.18]MEC4868224.1 S-layer homology domain-containing protein [Jaaginema sp. PMC 1078.18]
MQQFYYNFGTKVAIATASTALFAGSFAPIVTAQTHFEAQPPLEIALEFPDVMPNSWANPFIAKLLTEGIIQGFPNGQFVPNGPVTRAQFAAMIAQAFEKRTTVRDVVSFSDVSSSYWGYESIRQAYAMGFLDTVSGREFNPNEPMTRLDIILALTQGLNYTYTETTDSILQQFTDVSAIPREYRSAIAAAALRGLLIKYPNTNTLNLTQVATRAEVAAFLYQALVSTNDFTAVTSPYILNIEEVTNTNTNITAPNNPGTTTVTPERGRDRQNCNQGIGNGSEGCDPGNSSPHGGSNDEGGRTPGQRP